MAKGRNSERHHDLREFTGVLTSLCMKRVFSAFPRLRGESSVPRSLVYSSIKPVVVAYTDTDCDTSLIFRDTALRFWCCDGAWSSRQSASRSLHFVMLKVCSHERQLLISPPSLPAFHNLFSMSACVFLNTLCEWTLPWGRVVL